ncbi:hypothetical protein ACUX56_22050, partial [Salmonella enterica]|uniref:hypothetical protein n=1 Tax=Salmonella sp. L-S2359 TaxID=2933318 RepID=UPI001FF35B58
FRYLSSARDRDISRMRGDGMLTSKEAKNNANNHSLQACQSGTWRKSNSGSTVITGRIANGQQIPLPTGFSASQCSWSVSNAENPQGWKPNYFAGSVATYDANRIVKCGFYDEYNFHKGTFRADLTGKCSYVVACQN